MRTSILLFLITGLLSLSARTAWALDTEPNDACTSGETVSTVTFGGGELSTSSDVDAFLYTAPTGAFLATLVNMDNPDDDFLLELYDSTGATLFDSAASASGGPR